MNRREKLKAAGENWRLISMWDDPRNADVIAPKQSKSEEGGKD